jgi:rhodanese-related sulfurtransferase
MRKSIVVTTLAVLLIAVFAQAQMKPAPKGTANTPGTTPLVVTGAQRAQSGSFPRISQADAYKLYQQGRAVFVDVRSNAQFTQGHIKGALSIPGSQVVARFSEVTPGKTVITYCACSAEQSSGHAASNLVNHGVKNVWALKGGWNDWKANGYPVEAGAK